MILLPKLSTFFLLPSAAYCSVLPDSHRQPSVPPAAKHSPVLPVYKHNHMHRYMGTYNQQTAPPVPSSPKNNPALQRNGHCFFVFHA